MTVRHSSALFLAKHVFAWCAGGVSLIVSAWAAPRVTQIEPPPGAEVGSLNEVSVTFSEPVTGVDAAALKINDRLPSMVSGSGAGPYRFIFTQPEAGTVAVSWDADHSIAGIGTGMLEITTPSWSYTLTDTTPPAIGQITSSVTGQELPALRPQPGAMVEGLAEAHVMFSEEVTGVDAGDLLINGVPATAVTGSGAGPYVFTFPEPPVGNVSFQWAANSGIVDAAGLAFDGAAAGWGVTRVANRGTVIISEFLAANGGVMPSPARGIRDEDFDPKPWVELHNTGSVAVNLLGWALSDDVGAPGRWVFPARTLAPGARLVVWCSGKNRRPATGHLHTNFELSLNGGTLALYAPDSPAGEPVSVIKDYPPQRYDYSYGLSDDGNGWRYFSPPTVTQANYTMPSSSNPTPNPPAVPQGAPNGNSALSSVLAPPQVSVRRGYFDQPFPLILSAEPGATIHYTLDGSPPGPSAPVYTEPLTITNTTVLRAVAYAPGGVPSEIVTHTYLFPESVFEQASPPYNNPARTNDDDNPEPPSVGGKPLPVAWGQNSTGGFPGRITNLSANQVPADYGMDPKVYADPTRYADDGSIDPENGVTNRERIQKALGTLPALSIVMDSDAMWGPGGLYPTASESDKTDRTKPCSLEMLLPEGGALFAVDAGIDLHGNASRAPYKNPKHGFTLKFRGRYGAPKLEAELFPESPVRKWDKLVLRADFNSSWLHQNGGTGLDGNSQRPRGIRIRDAWSKDTFRDMGRHAGHHRYVNLFINGIFWGTYDLAEDQDADYAASYFGGRPGDYDVVEQGVLKNGTWTAYREMKALLGWTGSTRNTAPSSSVLNSPFSNESYEEIKKYLDVPWFVDYMLLHFFTGHQDWATTSDYNKNWYAVRHRNGLFRYLPWDQENLLWGPNDNRVNAEYPPTAIHPRLRQNAEYRLNFADRVYRHCVAPDGALRPEANIARLRKWTAVMDANAICLESARWGDYRYQVHRYASGVFTEVYTWNGRWMEGDVFRTNTPNTNYWLAEIRRLESQYFPVRTNNVLNQLRSANLYPRVNAPEAKDDATGEVVASRQVPAGWKLRLALPTPPPSGTTSNGVIWYTTDGTDPRVPYDTTGQRSPSAQMYSGPITIDRTTTVKARALDGQTWSALMEIVLTVGSSRPDVRLTELHYNPPSSQGGSAAEFVEIKNMGSAPADLSQWSFRGINFIFPHGFVLGPGDIAVVANNEAPATFAAQYPEVVVAGYFGGNLSNGGERIELRDRSGSIIDAVEYSDRLPWPTAPDNGGYSLERVALTGDSQSPASWRASTVLKGTPGRDPVLPETPPLLLSELFWQNAGGYAVEGKYPGYVELHNPGEAPVEAGGWHLMLDQNATFTVPSGTVVEPGGYLVVHFSPEEVPGVWMPVATEVLAGTVLLLNPGGAVVDGVRLGPQAADFSFGRVGGQWRLGRPSPGAPHVAAETASVAYLRFNEWLTAPLPDETGWLEFYNTHPTLPVVLSGVELFVGKQSTRYTALAAVAPQGWARLWCDETSTRADALLVSLPARDTQLSLKDETGQVVDQITVAVLPAGKSQGRLPDGTGEVTEFAFPSPGLANHGPITDAPRINEILVYNLSGPYTPWARRPGWVELHNPHQQSVTLEGWELRTGGPTSRSFRFPAGMTLPPGAYLAVWCDASQPSGFTSPEHGNTGFDLEPPVTRLELRTPEGALVDTIAWGPQVVDLSIGRVTEGSWALLAEPTRGQANAPAAELATIPVKLNEWSAAGPDGRPEFIEFFNSDTKPAALDGLWLSDDPSMAGRRKWRMPPLSFIPAGGYLVWGSKTEGLFPAAYDFSLSSVGGVLRLARGDAAEDVLEQVAFGAVSPTAQTQGRLPDGETVAEGLRPTPGTANQATAGPFFLEHPRSQTVPLGQPFTLRVLAEGAVSLTWLRNGVPLAGQTAVLSVPAAALESEGEYVCVATGPEGSATSQPAVVSVLFNYANWAAHYGVGAPEDDDDLDGVANAWEFLAGSPPQQPTSLDRAPRFLGWPASGESPRVGVEVWLDPRAIYQGVLGEFSADLREGSWAVSPAVESEILPAVPEGPTRWRFYFSLPTPSEQQFFRLRLEP